MLLKNFYKIISTESRDNKHDITLMLNKDHDIFKGHFPDNPITPGVCMVQIIKELTEDILKTSLTLIKSNNIKFVAIINPNINPEIVISIEIQKLDDQQSVSIKSNASFEETVALKMSAEYKYA